MQGTGRIVGINLLIMAVYTVLSFGIFIMDSDQYAAMGYGIFMMGLIGVHALVLLIMGIIFFVKKENNKGKIYLISLLVVLLVGFSACFGGMAAFDLR